MFSEMIRFKEYRYNFVPIEPYRQWIEDLPLRAYGIFSLVESTEGQRSPHKNKEQEKQDGTSLKDSKSKKSRSNVVDDERSEIVPYNDKSLWDVSLLIEPPTGN